MQKSEVILAVAQEIVKISFIKSQAPSEIVD